MIGTFLHLYRKELSPPLRDQIVNAPGAANPLFLRTVLEELRQFGDFDHLPDKIRDYLQTSTPVELFRQVIRRWQADFHGDRDVVDRSLRHLWAVRQGLAENEWLALASHLVQRSCLWALGHDYLRQAIEAELLPAGEAKNQAHLAVADYFECHPAQREMTPRKAAEWPHQLHAAQAWDRLEACLTDIPLFLALFDAQTIWELTGYWHPLRNLGRDMGGCYSTAYARWIAVPVNGGDDYVPAQLGAFLLENGLYSAAEPLLKRAMESSERIFGPEHPNTLGSMHNLANLLQQTNRSDEAEPLLWQALAISEKALGNDHPDVARHLNSLAVLLQASNRLGEAEPLIRRALYIDQNRFGPDHPNVATDLNSLSCLLQADYRLAEAEPLQRRALTIDQTFYGKNHPNPSSTV